MSELPVEAQSKLNAARRFRAGRHVDVTELDVRARQLEVGMVEEIECIQPELETSSLPHWETLHHREVKIDKFRPGEYVAADIANGARLRRNEDGAGLRSRLHSRAEMTIEHLVWVAEVHGEAGDSGRPGRAVRELVQAAVVKRGSGEDGKRETGAILEDASSVPSADKLIQPTRNAAAEGPPVTDGELVNVTHHEAVAHVVAGAAAVGLAIARVGITADVLVRTEER